MRRTCRPAGGLSHVNELARGCGCAPGMSVREATQRLVAAPRREASNYPEYPEARHDLGTNRGGLRIVAVDSVSLVESEDAGQVVVSGSHGGVVSGQPSVTISVGAAAAFFNDAGIGIDEAGLGRLPRLDELGIAGATVSAESARIGDGRSTYEDGVVSRANDIAREFGIRVRMAARDAVETIA